MNKKERKMMKDYIKPTIKVVNMNGGCILAGASGNEISNTMGTKAKAYSRESSIWDDEEEEETTGGWFQ